MKCKIVNFEYFGIIIKWTSDFIQNSSWGDAAVRGDDH